MTTTIMETSIIMYENQSNKRILTSRDSHIAIKKRKIEINEKTEEKKMNLLINENNNLLLQKKIFLNKEHSKIIFVGIDPYNQFKPIIKLTRLPSNTIQLSIEEFISFIMHELTIINYFIKDKDNNKKQITESKFKLNFIQHNGTKFISLNQENNTLYMNYDCYIHFASVADEILHYLIKLRPLNFTSTYKDVMRQAYSLKGNLMQNVISLVINNNFEPMIQHAMIELVIFYPDKFDKFHNQCCDEQKWPSLPAITYRKT